MNQAEAEDLIKFLTGEGYKNVRALSDGTIVGTIDLMFTRGLCVDLDRDGWGTRYCYENRELADLAALFMVSGDDAPMEGYVATRGGKR